jgi:hypothetical protein
VSNAKAQGRMNVILAQAAAATKAQDPAQVQRTAWMPGQELSTQGRVGGTRTR